MPKVSIVIPVYNVEEYLRECLDSVVNQTLRDIEIICINDGSNDNSGAILDEYALIDERIAVIHKENGGYGKALNIGIDKACGEYVGIIEPDDYVEATMMEQLYYTAIANQVEIVKSDYVMFFGEEKGRIFEYCKLVSANELYDKVISPSFENGVIRGRLANWTGIYKKDFLLRHHIKHNETPGASFQDTGFWFQCMSYATRMVIIPKAFYFYRRDNPNSSVLNKEKVYCICDECDFIYNIIKRNEKTFQQLLPLYIYCKSDKYMWNYNRISEEYKLDFLKRMKNEFLKLEEDGELNLVFLNENERKKLRNIMDNPKQFFVESIKMSRMIHSLIEDFDQIIIYGAGMMGKKIFRAMYPEDRKKTIGFAVTQKDNNPNSFEGVEIKTINEYCGIKETAAVLVGTTVRYKSEIVKLLQDLKFRRIITLLDEIG